MESVFFFFFFFFFFFGRESCSLILTYASMCAKSVEDKNPEAAFMKETILNCV